MKSKTNKILKWTPSILVALIIALGAFMKLTAQPQLVELFSKTGLLPYMKLLGIAELLFVSLFLWPRSIRIGLFLLTGYFGGAMAVELSQHAFFIMPAAILALIWLAAWLRDNSLFSAVQPQQETAAAL
ncbi:DoxX family protein [Terrimonas alba]|uniref:DoxX family protein n=1 Tax=Terrimonas alba TaxID=3349636 RepID=UPI0035F28881